MHQDSYFLPNETEEYSDIPQLAFPEPQLPFPEPQQPKPKPASRAAQPAPKTPAIPMPATTPLPQDALHTARHTPAWVSVPQQSQPGGTHTDQHTLSRTSSLRDAPAHPAFPISGATPAPAVQPLDSARPSRTQTPLPIETGMQQTMQVPGLMALPFTSQSLPTIKYAPEEDSEEEELAPGNQQAKRAIINGIISLVVSLFTLTTVAGAAGLVIGTFAIIYGLVGLRYAQHLPDKTGKRQAIAGIVLGLLACVIVIAAFISRAPLSR